MAFKTRDLVVPVQAASDGAYMYIVGCGALSVKCDNTQNPPRPYVRTAPIDFELGTQTSANNLISLRYELQERLKLVNAALSAALGVDGADE